LRTRRSTPLILDIECLAQPPGTPEDRYRHIEAAITEIQQSGLDYQVQPLGTVAEGSPDEIWALARQVHEACLAAGAESVVTVAKFAQSAGTAYQNTMASLTAKFR